MSIKQRIDDLFGRHSFDPARLSIKRLCEDMPEYEKPIRNRIIQMIKEDKQLAEHVYVNRKDNDLALDEFALVAVKDILLGYFDEYLVSYLIECVDVENAVKRSQCLFKRKLYKLNRKELADLKQLALSEFSQWSIDLVLAEEHRRYPWRKWFRRAANGNHN